MAVCVLRGNFSESRSVRVRTNLDVAQRVRIRGLMVGVREGMRIGVCRMSVCRVLLLFTEERRSEPSTRFALGGRRSGRQG